MTFSRFCPWRKNGRPFPAHSPEDSSSGKGRAIASKPAIILADEPTGNLDTATSHDVMGLLKVAAKEFQQTIILITHDSDIAQMADRIVHIEDGRIVKAGDRYAG